MRRKLIENVGLFAVVLLAPGGFILGATLVARHYRNRAVPASDSEPPPNSRSTKSR